MKVLVLAIITLFTVALVSCNKKPEGQLPDATVFDNDPNMVEPETENFHATIGDGTAMHIIQLEMPEDTIDVWFNDETQSEGALVVGAEIDVTTHYVDGRRIAISYKTTAPGKAPKTEKPVVDEEPVEE